MITRQLGPFKLWMPRHTVIGKVTNQVDTVEALLRRLAVRTPVIYNISMTRINIVPPSELSDQHLVAEYREIFMVGSSLQRSIASKNWSKTSATLPLEFTLNAGHVKFFYNKGLYLEKRYHQIVREMKRREMNPDPSRVFKTEQWPRELYNDWSPNESDLRIIRERIKQRLNEKPGWYRWTKQI